MQSSILRQLVRQRWKFWAAATVTVSCMVFVLFLVTVSQSYTGQMSLSIAQTKGGGIGLQAAQLGFSPTPSARYVGIITSRRFAQEVERRVNLRRLYHMRTTEDAVDLILAGLTVNDNPRDGLLYVSLVLPGPARFGLRVAPTHEQVKTTVATATNLYDGLLKEYVATSDTDTDTILLNLAAEQVTKTRRDYDAAVKNLADFVRSRRSLPAGLPHYASSSINETSTVDIDSEAKSQFSLYSARANSEQEIQALEAEIRTGGLLRADQVKNLSALPAEDPLLVEARSRRNSARSSLQSLELQLGPDNPRVVVAREELTLTEHRLREQTETVLHGKTSRDVDVRVKLAAMKSRYEAILLQIALMEQKAHIGRESLTEFEQLRNEVALRLEVMKVTASQAAMLSLQVVSAQNRVRVVDYAVPPRHGSPGVLMMALLSLFLTLFGLICWVAFDYAAMMRSLSTARTAD